MTAGGGETCERVRHLYVHVPFCVSKCDYCDFHSGPLPHGAGGGAAGGGRGAAGGGGGAAGPADRALLERYVQRVLEKAAEWASERGVLGPLATLYVGGGTPTVLGDLLAELVEDLLVECGMLEDAEVTVEANPGTTDAALLGRLVRAGVGRVSLGVQSFDPAVLRTLGRSHDAAEAEAALGAVVSSGLRVSVDLMCGVPGQTRGGFVADVERLAVSGVEHVSVYALSLEPGTRMAERVEAGELELPDEDEAAWMMGAAQSILSAHGLERYEVASYARSGRRSVHNTAYWTGSPYLGIGPSAASMVPGSPAEDLALPPASGVPAEGGVGVRRVRFTYAPGDRWWTSSPPSEIDLLGAREADVEDVMLRMRLVDGVDAREVDRLDLTETFERLAGTGLVVAEGGRRRCSERGWLLGNEVFGAVWEAAKEA